MTKSIDNALKQLGFTAITRTLRACRAGDLVHAVSIGKDRYGSTRVSAYVWLSSLAEHDPEFELKDLQTPVAGNAAPGGLHPSWTWAPDAVPTEQVLRVLLGFFGQHATRSDVMASMEGAHINDEIRCLLESGQRRLDLEALIKGEARYPLPGGALGPERATSIAKGFLSRLATPLGFNVVNGPDVVAVRDRGEMQECVRILLDEFGTFAFAVVFPWTRRIWEADPRWSGTYYPMISADVRIGGQPWLAEVPGLNSSGAQGLAEAIEASIQSFRDIQGVQEFCERLGREWSTIGAQLRKLA